LAIAAEKYNQEMAIGTRTRDSAMSRWLFCPALKASSIAAEASQRTGAKATALLITSSAALRRTGISFMPGAGAVHAKVVAVTEQAIVAALVIGSEYTEAGRTGVRRTVIFVVALVRSLTGD
jgi:hypothetical protein